MPIDLEIALKALADGGEAWVRWMPEVAEDDRSEPLRQLVDEFESIDNHEAADSASAWLRNEALDNDGSTKTWLLLNERRLDGFYAIASTSVDLAQRDRKRLLPGSAHNLARRQPASLIAWIARSADSSEGTGKRLLLHAVTTASEVAALQGNIALVVDAHDRETAEMWIGEYGFKEASKAADGGPNDGDRPRLWAPLRDPI